MEFIDWYFTFVVFLFGACWGSFLNVCIYRIPAGLSVVKPRSRCPKCMTNLAWKDNIPIFGWFALRGKCRYCDASISPRYPFIELLTAILFTLVWVVYPYQWVALPYMVMVFGLILGSMVDFDYKWIPDRCTIGGMIVGPVFSLLIPAMHDADVWGGLYSLFGKSCSICEKIDPLFARGSHLGGFVDSLIGLAVGFGALWSVGALGKLILKKNAMGFGDVKLMGALGAFLGWESIIFIVFVSSLLGTLVGVPLIIFGQKEWQSKIPFGPYIALAAIVWMLGGSALWDLYIQWMQGAAC